MASRHTPDTRDYFDAVRAQRPTGDAVQSILDKTGPAKTESTARRWVYLLVVALMGVAAVCAYNYNSDASQKAQYTEAEVQLAYTQTKVALAYLSSKIDRSETYTSSTMNYFTKTQKSIAQ